MERRGGNWVIALTALAMNVPLAGHLWVRATAPVADLPVLARTAAVCHGKNCPSARREPISEWPGSEAYVAHVAQCSDWRRNCRFTVTVDAGKDGASQPVDDEVTRAVYETAMPGTRVPVRMAPPPFGPELVGGGNPGMMAGIVIMDGAGLAVLLLVAAFGARRRQRVQRLW